MTLPLPLWALRSLAFIRSTPLPPKKGLLPPPLRPLLPRPRLGLGVRLLSGGAGGRRPNSSTPAPLAADEADACDAAEPKPSAWASARERVGEVDSPPSSETSERLSETEPGMGVPFGRVVADAEEEEAEAAEAARS